MKHTVDVTGTPVATNYVWDVNRKLPMILQDGTNTYVYGLGLIPAIDGSNNATYYMSDGLGSTTDLTNGSGTRTDGYKYDAFGAATHSPGSSTQPFQFAGQQTDADSGLQYLRARYYDPTTGRFLARDPLAGSPQMPTTYYPYTYALNNPTNYADPQGLSPSNGEGDHFVTIDIQPEDNPYLIVNRILSALMPRLDDACLRDFACAQASHAQLTTLAPVAIQLLDFLRYRSCAVAIRDISGGFLFVAMGTLMRTAPPPTLFLGAGAIAFGGILLVRGTLNYIDNNCSTV